MRLLRLTPWRRGPALLARRPAVALALFAAAAVAALPAAAAPLFLSSAQHATLHRQIDDTCQWQVGAQFFGEVSPNIPFTFAPVIGEADIIGAPRYHQRAQVLADYPIDGLSAPVSTGYGDVNTALPDRTLPNPDATGLRLLARAGATDEVEALAGPTGEGLWLPHEFAQQQDLQVGDELVVSSRSFDPGVWELLTAENPQHADPVPVTLPVAAIYRDLRTTATSPYWCGVQDLYRGTDAERSDPNAVILPTALIDEETLLEAGEATHLIVGQTVEFALSDPELDAPAAAALAEDIATMRTTMFHEHPRLFPTGWYDDTQFASWLDRYQRRAALVRSGLLPPVLPITAAGTLVGLAVAGAAAFFWVQRRRRELTVLAAHGVSPGGLGLKAVVEALPAVAAGSAAGWAAGWTLITSVGPSPVLSPGTLPLAALSAAGIGLAAVVLIGVLAAGRTRALTDARPVSHRVGWWRRTPWELALIALAPVAWLLFDSDQVVDTTAGGVGSVLHIPARLLLAPILVITGLTILAARLLASWLGRSGIRRTPRSPARHLAWRRTIRTAMATAVLAGATAIPVAMATFGATATGTIKTTADAKLQFNLGSDTVVSYPRGIDRSMDNLPPPPPVPDSLVERTTEVLRLDQQRLDGLIVDVLAVDPATFTTGAFWDNRISGASLQEAVDVLAAGDTVTIVASRRVTPGPATLSIRDEQFPVEVANTRPLPGAQSAYPMVIVHQDLVERLSEHNRSLFTPQLWISGEPTETISAVHAASLPMSRMSSVDDQRSGAVYEPVTYTFQYLIALSVFTGLIGAIGLLLYLESRTATHRRAYVLLRRLGLAAGAHRRSLLLEIGAPVLAGVLAGLATALATAYVVRSGFDVNPGRFPAALLAPPTATAIAIAVAALAIAIGAGLLTHARIHRANPAEVLRDTP